MIPLAVPMAQDEPGLMNTQKNDSAELTCAQLEKLQNQLLDKRRELAHMIEELNKQITMKQDCSVADAAEAAGLSEERAQASAIAEQHHSLAIEINYALQRINNGRYGISEKSGEPIAYERLLLVPWARKGQTIDASDQHKRHTRIGIAIS